MLYIYIYENIFEYKKEEFFKYCKQACHISISYVIIGKIYKHIGVFMTSFGSIARIPKEWIVSDVKFMSHTY